MQMNSGMKVTALAPWFGSNRMLAERVGQELEGCAWVGVPFAGGMCELAHIRARTLAVNDKHRHVMNLATRVAYDASGLARQLARMPFHPDALLEAQEFCRLVEANGFQDTDSFEWAKYYFVCCWMGRSHKSGINDEFNGGLSIRWNANGGDSAVRYRSAVKSLAAWQRVMRRCTFTTMDCFDFLDRCEDSGTHGIYCDPPFPGPGDRYKHRFSESEQRRLAKRLAQFRIARVVCRFYDHPLIREIYQEPKWTWRNLNGRTQANTEAPEVLIVSRSQNGRLFS